jgi:hypothetical protein
METTHEVKHPAPGVGAALIAFAVFAGIAGASLFVAHRRPVLVATAGPSESIRESADRSRLEVVAVMKRISYRSDTAAFRKAELVTVAGRSSLDLSGARMAGESGQMEVVVLGGRAEVKVPPEWAVIADTVAVGAMENRARHAEGNPVRTLRLKAVVLGGWLEVTH